MVFIDGTWLYYSIYGGRVNCPMKEKFGADWPYSHRVAFEQLPAIIAKSLHQQLLDFSQVQRFVEIVRTVVFTSARADTPSRSFRMRMFQQMEDANFEVHMRTTAGLQEKCVDIALAVEMMHYASMDNAYDLAVLVTGDKDFMPALSRIRQRGKRIALCSMRICCSRDLTDPSSHVLDFRPIWLEDSLDTLIQPNLRSSGIQNLSISQLMQLVVKYLNSQPSKTASSRDIGRFLRSQPGLEARQNALATLKQNHFSLKSFILEHPAWFHVSKSGEDGESEFEFTVKLLDGDLTEGEDEHELIDAKIGRTSVVDSRREEAAQYSTAVEERKGEDALLQALQQSTVPELREELRLRGLPQTGRKHELVQRLYDGMNDTPSPKTSSEAEDDTAMDQMLIGTVTRYLSVSGGSESSRNIGRHLATRGQLQHLKQLYSGLFHFLQTHGELFRIELPSSSDRSANSFEYQVFLKQKQGIETRRSPAVVDEDAVASN